MKVLIIVPYFFPKIGGMENYAYNIAKGLKVKHGWDVIVITSNHEEKKFKVEIINGLKIYRLPTWFKISNTPLNPFWYFQIRKIIKKENPEIINAHTPVPFISDIAERTSKNKPYVLTYHGDLIKENLILNLFIKIYYFALGSQTIKRSNKIIATSEYYAKNSHYLKKYLNKIAFVPPGVNMKRFNLKVNKNYLKNKYGNRPIILFVGQLDKTHTHKGIFYLFDAMSIVKKTFDDCLLLAVGKGDNLESYKKYVKEKGLDKNIIFTGFVKDIDLPKYYAGANVTVLPTYDNSEGFGMVLIEAGACGSPVIGTEVGGIPYVVENNKTGILVPPKDSKDLAEAIIKLFSNTRFAIELGMNGHKKIINNFIWDQSVTKTNDLLIRLI